MTAIKFEPTLIIQSVVAALEAVQVSTIHMSTLAHTLVAIAIISIGAFVNRSQVSPSP